MLGKAEAARLLVGGGAPVVDFRFGAISPLKGAQVNELMDLSGNAIVIGVSRGLLAASRRDGGLAHKFGVFDFETMKLGALFIRGDDELHVVLIEAATPECRALLARAQTAKRLHVLAVAEKTDSRLMVIGRSEGLDMLCTAAQGDRPGSTVEVTQAVAAALEFVASPDNLTSLALPTPLPERVIAHFVLTPSREADIERTTHKDPLH